MKRLIIYIFIILIPFFTFSQVTISGDVSIIGSGNVNLFLNGNFTNNYNGNSIYEGFYSSGKVFFQGNTAQSIEGSATSLFIHNFEMNNPTGVNIDISEMYIYNLVFSAGKISHRGSLFIEDGGSVTGANSNMYVIGSVTKFGADDFIFPIGNNITYAPIKISNISGSSSFKAAYFQGTPPDNTQIPVNIKKISSVEYWDLDRLVSSSSADVTLYWENSRKSKIGRDLSKLYLTHHNSTTNSWDNAWSGTKNGKGGLLFASKGSITQQTVTDFSYFTFGTSDILNNPLPITLLYFNLKTLPHDIEITWVTVSEKNNDYFTVERSKDEINWYVVDTINASGDNSTLKKYILIDKTPYSGVSYYRLKQTDYNGVSTYFKSKSISFGYNRYNNIAIYPNPTKGDIHIDVPMDKIEKVEVYDNMGRKIFEEKNSNNISLKGYSKGFYFIRVIIDGNVYVNKIELFK